MKTLRELKADYEAQALRVTAATEAMLKCKLAPDADVALGLLLRHMTIYLDEQAALTMHYRNRALEMKTLLVDIHREVSDHPALTARILSILKKESQ